MVSQFGLLGYTIMGKTADLTVVQKTIIDTLHKEGKIQTFIAKEAGCSQTEELRDWGWGQGIKSHHTQTCQGIWLQLSSEASYLG